MTFTRIGELALTGIKSRTKPREFQAKLGLRRSALNPESKQSDLRGSGGNRSDLVRKNRSGCKDPREYQQPIALKSLRNFIANRSTLSGTRGAESRLIRKGNSARRRVQQVQVGLYMGEDLSRTSYEYAWRDTSACSGMPGAIEIRWDRAQKEREKERGTTARSFRDPLRRLIGSRGISRVRRNAAITRIHAYNSRATDRRGWTRESTSGVEERESRDERGGFEERILSAKFCLLARRVRFELPSELFRGNSA